ncbi:MAG TPA: FHA domain-containing protein [Polyangiaceae bacterium]|nr:FHA domain-containing protein [Polyangiaceae bacterium]
MLRVDLLIRAANATSREKFVAANAGLFLVVYSHESEAISFSTRLQAPTSGRPPPADEVAAVFPIVKSERSPYSERISLGRATNCDIVLRHASISKLHAHFKPGRDSELEITDLDSRNGTRVNDRKLPPNAPRQLSVGDVIQFGTVPTRLVDGSGLFDLLHGDDEPPLGQAM